MSGGVPKWGNKVAATGKLEVSGVAVLAREGLVIKNATMIAIKAYQDSEIVLVVSARSDSPQAASIAAEPRSRWPDGPIALACSQGRRVAVQESLRRRRRLRCPRL